MALPPRLPLLCRRRPSPFATEAPPQRRRLRDAAWRLCLCPAPGLRCPTSAAQVPPLCLRGSLLLAPGLRYSASAAPVLRGSESPALQPRGFGSAALPPWLRLCGSASATRSWQFCLSNSDLEGSHRQPRFCVPTSGRPPPGGHLPCSASVALLRGSVSGAPPWWPRLCGSTSAALPPRPRLHGSASASLSPWLRLHG